VIGSNSKFIPTVPHRANDLPILNPSRDARDPPAAGQELLSLCSVCFFSTLSCHLLYFLQRQTAACPQFLRLPQSADDNIVSEALNKSIPQLRFWFVEY
jgi:hypothetical protein